MWIKSLILIQSAIWKKNTRSFLIFGLLRILHVLFVIRLAKGINPKEFNGELLYKMAEEGDPVVLDMLEDFYFTTAKYLFNIFAIVDPDIILLGGGISAQPAFVEGVKRYVEKLKSISMITNFIKVDVCKFGNDSNLLGALYSFRQMYLEN